MGQPVGRLQRRQNTFKQITLAEGMQGALVVNRHILGALDIFQPGMLRANTRVIQSRRN